MPAKDRPALYGSIIEHIFEAHYLPGAVEFEFPRSEIVSAAQELGIDLPKNLGDLIYSFRYRAKLPASILSHAPNGMEWIIESAGRSLYRLALRPTFNIEPNPNLAETKIPDSTPGLIEMYALSDEQSLLAKLRYNRLIDTFTGVTCYSLQNHLRTSHSKLGQVETDEVYVGLDRRGAHFVFPVQAKGGRDKLGVIQLKQDFALCAEKFPNLICRPIAAQFMSGDLISLFEFEQVEDSVAITMERHYRLVPSEDVETDDIKRYGVRSLDD